MIAMCLDDIEECMPDCPPAEDRMRAYINEVRLDAERTKANIWLIYRGEIPVGFCIARMEWLWYTEAMSSRLCTLYIKQSERGGFLLLKMFKAYELWAKDNGSKVSFCGVERENIQEAAIIQRVFPRLGYKWAGSNFTRRL